MAEGGDWVSWKEPAFPGSGRRLGGKVGGSESREMLTRKNSKIGNATWPEKKKAILSYCNSMNGP